MNNGVNETNNQTIPGVKVAMPDAKLVDASTADAGAALSNAVRINEQPSQPVMASVVPVASAPTPVVPVVQQTVQPVATVPAAPVMQVQTPVIQPVPSVQATVQPTMQTVAPAAVMTNVVTENPTEVDNGKKKKNKKPTTKLARFFFFISVIPHSTKSACSLFTSFVLSERSCFASRIILRLFKSTSDGSGTIGNSSSSWVFTSRASFRASSLSVFFNDL